MIAKSMMTVLLGSTLLATAALAQAPSPSTTAPAPAEKMAPADSTMSHQGQWRASKVVNLKIYNNGNESLGTVNDLLMDSQGRITTAVIAVGGFLGVGEHYVAVPFDKIKWVDTPAPSTTASTTSTGSGMTGRPTTTTGTTTGAATTATPSAKTNPWYPDHGVLSVTKEELKAMPEFKYST